MKQDFLNDQNKEAEIVIPDECGDTLWDAVLQQEMKIYETAEISNNANALLNKITGVKECDANKA